MQKNSTPPITFPFELIAHKLHMIYYFIKGLSTRINKPHTIQKTGRRISIDKMYLR